MGTSLDSYRPRLYRKRAHAVTLACFAVMFAGLLVLQPFLQLADGQFAKQRKLDTGPRAVGLLKIDAKGRAQLASIVIMIDGKFYDAGAYKADPVPMALQRGTVYEGFQSGVSQGLFTTGGAANGLDGWHADGKWRTNAQIEAEKAKAKAEAEKKAIKASDEPMNSGPPRLKRPADAPKGSSTGSPDAKKTLPAPAPSGGTGASSPPSSSAPSSADTSAKTSSKADADRPVLRRQEQSETSHEQTKVTSEDMKPPFQWVPAISDAGGPDPRPYAFQMKPEEQAGFLKKMLAMAGLEVNGWAEGQSPEAGEKIASTSTSKTSHKPALGKAKASVRPTRAAEFQDVQLHVFDLSNSNEPVLILTASATQPSRADVVFTIALVAREDIYGELHKVSAQITDTQHLDVLPKYEFIDAVDVDGDGRGELLFRLTSDAGTAYAIYSVIGDKLWPLFEGKPGR